MSISADLEALGQSDATEFRGETTINVGLTSLYATLNRCKELGYEMLLDISSLDHMGEEPRFEMVYELATLDDSKHLRVKSKVAEDVEVPSAVNLWKTANWHESLISRCAKISRSLVRRVKCRMWPLVALLRSKVGPLSPVLDRPVSQVSLAQKERAKSFCQRSRFQKAMLSESVAFFFVSGGIDSFQLTSILRPPNFFQDPL